MEIGNINKKVGVIIIMKGVNDKGIGDRKRIKVLVSVAGHTPPTNTVFLI